MAFRDNARGNLRDLVESHGTQTITNILVEQLQQGKLKPDEMSLRELWDAYTNFANPATPVHKLEAVTTGALTTVTGELINAKIIAGYQMPGLIGDQLVTIIPSKVKEEKVAGFSDVAPPEEVPEHIPYKDSTFGDKYVTVKNYKYGRILSITEEAIHFDQTAQILKHAQRIGQRASLFREEKILRAVQDLDTAAYYPSGTATALYSATHGNLITGNALSSAGLSAVERAAQMMQSDAMEDPGYIMLALYGSQLLIPSELSSTAWELATGTEHPETAERALNYWKNRFTPLTSPYITAQSSSTWYWGNFAESFVLTEVWPLQTFSAAPGHEDEFHKDVKFKYKIRMYFGIGATDYRLVYRCTA